MSIKVNYQIRRRVRACFNMNMRLQEGRGGRHRRFATYSDSATYPR
jgi:hypothetical protein